MLVFFDLLFYNIFIIYNVTKDKSPEISACFGVAGLQTFNILTGIMFYGFLRGNEIHITKLFGGGLILSLLILNYIRYIQFENYSHYSIKEKWEKKTINYQSNMKILLLIYVIFSCLFFFGFIGYYAGRR